MGTLVFGGHKVFDNFIFILNTFTFRKFWFFILFLFCFNVYKSPTPLTWSLFNSRLGTSGDTNFEFEILNSREWIRT